MWAGRRVGGETSGRERFVEKVEVRNKKPSPVQTVGTPLT